MLAADALVLASPVYKGSYCGLFKHLLDLLDPLSLAGKPVLLGATGGGPRHALVIEHQLRPLLGFFEAQTLATGHLCRRHGLPGRGRRLGGRALERLDRAVGQFAPFLATPEPVGIERRRVAARRRRPRPSDRPTAEPPGSTRSGEIDDDHVRSTDQVRLLGPQRLGRPRDQQHRAAHRLGHRLQPQAGADRRGERVRLCAEPDPLHRRLRRRQPARVGFVQPRAGGGDREADGDRGAAAGAVEPGAGGEADRDDQPPDRRPHRGQRGQRLVPRRVRSDRRAVARPRRALPPVGGVHPGAARHLDRGSVHLRRRLLPLPQLLDAAEADRSAAGDLPGRLEPRGARHGGAGVGLVLHQRQHARKASASRSRTSARRRRPRAGR